MIQLWALGLKYNHFMYIDCYLHIIIYRYNDIYYGKGNRVELGGGGSKKNFIGGSKI